MKSSDEQKLQMRSRYAALKEAGLCPQCGKKPQEDGKIVCNECNEKRLAWHAKNREKSNRNALERRLRLWRTVLDAYGPGCDCCGETHIEFLTIDHKNGGGRQHRKELSTTAQMLNWIIKNGFPDSIRILCMNCNLSYGVRGYCPHQKES